MSTKLQMEFVANNISEAVCCVMQYLSRPLEDK